jgi:acyl transferase domain-containing protein/NAD(P)H-dependent flavin oxidoreductase YrpB (nitropropane dioxygenase family)/NAD(P)-dependent dehydrogenase (short-subunit alcohol dehydrogenase family)
MPSPFQFIALTPPGITDTEIPVAAINAGNPGFADLASVSGSNAAYQVIAALLRSTERNRGVRILASQINQIKIPAEIDALILSEAEGEDLPRLIETVKAGRRTVYLEAISCDQARRGEAAGADAIVVKGNEAGGWVGEETTFVLLQQILRSLRIPAFAQGGIGLHTAAACYAAGAAGVVLDSQLALTSESSLDSDSRSMLTRMDGTETLYLGGVDGPGCRFYCRGGLRQSEELRCVATSFAGKPDGAKAWRAHISERVGTTKQGLWLIGQDSAFAAPLASNYSTVRQVIRAFHGALRDHVQLANATDSIGPGSALAQSHGTRYPIVQGPMTRVSDTSQFAVEVGARGGLPLLALALMRPPELSKLLEQTSRAMAGRPWGVGILGFVPAELRTQQIEIVVRYRPAFALIAGGRPDQCADLERAGITSYLHVPSPALLRSYFESGARRFVFEGRECGGHVGPRSSFVLWNTMIEVLEEMLPAETNEQVHVLFAGGIHDALSASMAAVMAAPLTARGVRVGVLLGTAYLFTQEAVTSGAIVPGFQEAALSCINTALLESGPGHAIRCIRTPYVDFFEHQKNCLRESGKDADEIRAILENLNLGRLRIASKGVRKGSQAGEFETLAPHQQLSDGMFMIGQIAALRDRVCTIEELHRDVSVGASERIQQLAIPEDDVRPSSFHHQPGAGIAIIGMSCLLPKASTLKAYWENILNKIDAITEVPRDRWDVRRYFSDDPKARDRTRSRWGGFLDEIPFDPVIHGMPPSSMDSTEPLQLLTLEAVRMALGDAGYSARPFPREHTSVILGLGGGIADLGLQYAVRSALPMFPDAVAQAAAERFPDWTENTFPGILLNVVAGRVANRFDLGGVNYTVDGACASSLAAVYQAVRELETGTSDLVITGGADTLQSPFTYLCFSNTSALSERGRCRTFDESADGIAISEGIVILVLKRLAEAERDGDRIYAVIKGIAGSSDGRDKGLTAPRLEGQVRALERAYRRANLSPADVALVEAHGTGTVVGDRVEIEALTKVYRSAGAASRSCAIGSVKSNIGHTKSTAGAAGLAKTALALHCKVLPPTIGVNNPNQALVRESPFYVNTTARPWIATPNGTPRRAAVSAFGFGGTNFHAVLEEYIGDHSSEAGLENRPSELLLFTAHSELELAKKLRSLDAALERGAHPRLIDLAYTLWRIAQCGPENPNALTLAIVAASPQELRERIALSLPIITRRERGWDDGGVYFSGINPRNNGKIAFLFPGQGSQYADMLSDLAIHFPEVRRRFEIADQVLADRFASPLSSYIFPPPRFGAEEDRKAKEAITSTNIAQPALGAADMAMFRLLASFGVHADMAAGHSYGEYVALCAAGVFSEEVLYGLSEARGRFMLNSSDHERGTMAAIEAGRAEVAGLLRLSDNVCIANVNAPDQTVISGTEAGIWEVSQRCEAAGLRVRSLSVSCAFHSPLVAVAKDSLAQLLSVTDFASPRFSVFSNMTARVYPSGREEIAGLLSEHLTNPVDFVGEIEAMYEAGARIFIEAGPRATLTGLTRRILNGKPHFAFSLETPTRSGLTQLQHVLGQLAALGVPVQMNPWYRQRGVRELNLASLVEDTKPPSLSPTTWMVNGGKAWPASGPKPTGPEPIIMPTSPVASEAATAFQLPNTKAASRYSGESEQVLLQFQKVMANIMDTQREVMLAYLGNGHANRNGHASHSQPALEINSPAVGSRPVPAAFPIREEAPESVDNRSEQSVRETLLQIVSERTGYPKEVLDPSLRIEGDLGIDSLKLSEILAAFLAALKPDDQSLIRTSMDQLTRARTFDAMIGLAEDLLSHKAPAAVSGANLSESSQTVSRSKLVAVEASATISEMPIDGSFLITDDEQGVAALLSAKLRQLGAQASLVRHGAAFGAQSDDTFIANLCDPDSVRQLTQAVRQNQGRLSGIIDLLPLGTTGVLNQGNVDGWRERLELEVKSLFHLASAAAADLNGDRCSQRSLLLSAAPAVPGQRGVIGLLKCLAKEWPGTRCKAVTLDTNESASEQMLGLMGEISALDDEVEVRYVRSNRLITGATPAERPELCTGKREIDSSSVILITGGARGITAEIAKHWAKIYRPTLFILGRSTDPEIEEDSATAGLTSPQDLRTALIAKMKSGRNGTLVDVETEFRNLLRRREVRANLSEMRKAGANVKYFSVDVRNEGAFGGLIRSLYREHGRIDGVIHGAGVIDDKLIEHKSAESFDRVFSTKVRGAFVLSRELDPRSLRFLVFFSSIAACFGNRGQADYAAANGVLDTLAGHLDHIWPARVFSINWGPWAQTGMVSPALHEQFVAQGIEPIPTVQGVQSFEWEIQNWQKGEGSIILGHGPWATAGTQDCAVLSAARSVGSHA